MILQGPNNNNADVLGYFTTLTDAKEVLLRLYKGNEDVFILMMQGVQFGEGFHKYTLRYNGKKFIKNSIAKVY